MIIDIVVGVVVLASALISFMRGFIREVLTIAGVVGGILAAVFTGPVFAPMVREWFGAGEGQEPSKLFDIVPMEIVADATTYGVIFIAVVIVLSVISHFISGAAKAVGLGPVDRTLGVIFGVARALILLGLVYLPFHLLMDQPRKDEYFADSNTHYIIEKISAVMAGYLPESDDVKKEIETTTDDVIKRKLEEQNLLGSSRKDEPPQPQPKDPAKTGAGYDDKERQQMDRLFSEPAPGELAPATPTVNE